MKEFSVSKEFTGPTRKSILAAMKKIKEGILPDGVTVITPSEIDQAQQPFIVVTAQILSDSSMVHAYEKGAFKYVQTGYGPGDLERKLSGQ